MGTMPDLALYLVLFLFHAVALLGLNLALARFVPSRFARYRVGYQCNKYTNHTQYVLTVGEDIKISFTSLQTGRRPSGNGSLSTSRR